MSSIVPFEMRLVEFYAYRRKPPSAFDEYVFTAIFQSAIFPLTTVFFSFLLPFDCIRNRSDVA